MIQFDDIAPVRPGNRISGPDPSPPEPHPRDAVPRGTLRRAAFMQSVRVASGLALAAAGLLLASRCVGYATSTKGMVSASRVPITSRIAGTVRQLHFGVGDSVEAGAVLALVTNEAATRVQGRTLRTHRSMVDARLVAVEGELRGVDLEAARLQQDYRRQRDVEVANLEWRRREAEATLAATLEARQQADAEDQSAQSLVKAGVLPVLESARIGRAARVSAAEALAAEARVARLQLQIDNAREGYFVEASAPFQRQRITELTRRRFELVLAATELRSSLATIDRSIAETEADATLTESHLLLSPVAGWIWSRGVSPTQVITAGAELLSVVDASTVRVEATFLQRHRHRLRVGDSVLVFPIGRTSAVPGVIHWMGALAHGPAAITVPEVPDTGAGEMRVVITLRPTDQRSLWVGQDARVLVPLRAPWRRAFRWIALPLLSTSR